MALIQSVQEHFGNQVRLLLIDKDTHPEVVQSFGIVQTPAFLSVQQGEEIWRQQNRLLGNDTLVGLIRGVLVENQPYD